MRKGSLLFVVVALAQWAVPMWMVRGKERVLTDGTEYRFKLRPIDPDDPFRGEYVTLNYAAFSAPVTLTDTSLEQGRFDGYAMIGTADDGYARVVGISVDRPEAGDYVRVTGYSYVQFDTAGVPQRPRVMENLEPDFTNFYLQEGGGRVAEDLVGWRPDTAALREAYALVRVYHGDAVIKDLIIGGRPVHDWIRDAEAAPEATGPTP